MTDRQHTSRPTRRSTAREDHDAHLLWQESGYARVWHGNAVERWNRPRRRQLQALRRLACTLGLMVDALVHWLRAPSPWEPRP